MKVPLGNTQLDEVMTKLQNEQEEFFEPHDFGPSDDQNFPVPNEIVIKIYKYLNTVDLSNCAQVSKRMRSLCFFKLFDYPQKFSMPILYKKSVPVLTCPILPLLLRTCVKVHIF